MSIVVAGKEYIIPQGVAYFEKTPPARAADVAVGNCLIVGEAGGGVPYNVNVNDLPPIYNFTNPSEAKSILKSGDGLTSLLEAFKHGAQRVFFLRTQSSAGTVPAKQAEFDDTTNKIKIESADYSDFGNRISVEHDWTSGTPDTVVTTLRLYNLGEIIVAQDTADSSATTVLTDSGKGFDTLGLVAFNATTKAGDLLHIIDDNSTGAKNGYYPIASWDANTVTVTVALGTLTSPVYEIVRVASVESEVSDAMADDNATVNQWLNGMGNIRQYITSQVTGTAAFSADVAETFLYGGADGEADSTDVETALSKCVTTNAQLRHVASSDSASFGKLPAHIIEATNAGYKSIGFVGGGTADSVSTIKGYATTFDTDRMVVCAPANQDRDLNENLGLIGGWAVAAKVMGVAASLDPAVPLTKKKIQAIGLSAVYLQSEREELQEAGVLVVQQTPDGKEIQKGVTTLQDNTNLWTSGVNPKTPEISLRRIADAISMSVARGTGRDFVGQNARYAGAGLEGYLEATLKDFEENKGWLVEGEDADTGEKIPAYEIYRIYKVADAFYADAGLNFSDPVNFVVFKGIIL